MGQFCSGGSGPDLDIKTDRIDEMIKGSLGAAELQSKELVQIYKAGIAEAGDEPYKVPDSEMEFTKESTEQDIGKAAVATAFAAVDTEELKATIWKEIEADLDKQIEAMEEEKRPVAEEIEASKKDIKAREVDDKVSSAFTAKQEELEKSYDPEPEKPEEDAQDDEKAEEAKEDAAEDKPAEDAPADDAAKEEEKPAEDAPKEEDKAADEPAAEEPAAEEDKAAEEPAAEEAAGDE